MAVSALRRFRRYPAYKDSGVEWLGEIPAHWQIRRLKLIAPIRRSKVVEKPADAIYVGLEHVESWTGKLLLDNQPESVDSIVTSFKAGDVLFGKLRPYLAKAARPDFDGVCTSEILALLPSVECSPNYLMFCLLNAAFIRWLDSLTYGTKMPRVSPEQIASSSIPFPLPCEQEAITAFLDRETARIDALVAKKERLIELLQEKRTALITRAVTKGLDPTVPMKDSGVEWLGEIPAHWDVRPNGALFVERDERGVDDVPILEVSIASGVRVREFSQSKIEQRSDDLGTYKVARTSDIAFNKMRMWQGAVGVTPQDGLVSPDYVVARPLPVSDARYYALVFRTSLYMAEVYRWSHGIVDDRNRLYWDDFKAIRSPFPPPGEQRAIAEFLERERTRTGALVAKVREAIDRLKELRSALISAAVTGKIDVRGEVA